MGEDEKTTTQTPAPVRRGSIRPKTDLVKSFFVRLQKWMVTEPFGTDPDFVRAVKYLGKFVAKQRKTNQKSG